LPLGYQAENRFLVSVWGMQLEVFGQNFVLARRTYAKPTT